MTARNPRGLTIAQASRTLVLTSGRLLVIKEEPPPFFFPVALNRIRNLKVTRPRGSDILKAMGLIPPDAERVSCFEADLRFKLRSDEVMIELDCQVPEIGDPGDPDDWVRCAWSTQASAAAAF